MVRKLALAAVAATAAATAGLWLLGWAYEAGLRDGKRIGRVTGRRQGFNECLDSQMQTNWTPVKAYPDPEVNPWKVAA